MAKIVIVEDDPMISEIYHRKLEQAGFDVKAVSSGKEVLALAKTEAIDLILLDLVMSEMGGLDVLKELRSGKYSKEIKVIIFSNLREKETQDQALELGADGFISKSEFTPSELVKEVTRLLSQFNEQRDNLQNQTAANEESTTDSKKKGKRILFIEDEEIFLDLFGKKLRDNGYDVEFARNGAWGLKEIMDKDFDLIVMDVVMPSMSGKEILERIKLEESKKNIPIIVLSASVEDSDLLDMEKMGVTASFVKTRVVPSDLSKKVDEILK